MSRKAGLWQRLWKPFALTGASGTALLVWFEEVFLFIQEILALIFLPILAGIIYLLDTFLFKSRMPRREDLTDSNPQGDHR